MNLRHLIEAVQRRGAHMEVAADLGQLEVEVNSVTDRVEQANPQTILVALDSSPGTIAAAIRGGVAALVVEAQSGPAVAGTCSVPVLKVHEARRTLNQLLTALYGNPAAQLRLTAVTGPGQTTVAFLLQACLSRAGFAPGLWADPSGGSGPLSLDVQGFPAGLFPFLHHLVARGGDAAVLSLCPRDLVSGQFEGVPLSGLAYLGPRTRHGALSSAPAETEVLLTPARCSVAAPAEATRCSFGLGGGADFATHLLVPSTRRHRCWGQHVELSLSPAARRALAHGPLAGVPLAPSLRLRLATPGPAARRAAAAAAGAALLNGVPPEALGEAFLAFPGVWRRGQVVYEGAFTVVDFLTRTPAETAAALAALREYDQTQLGPFRELHPVHALTGGAGGPYQTAIARTFARLLPRRRTARLILTESRRHAPEACRTSREERVAFAAACAEEGLPVDFYPELEDAVAGAVMAAGDGDLLLFTGGPGMDAGQVVLGELLTAHRGLLREDPYDELAGPLLRPLSARELIRPENLPASRPLHQVLPR